MASLLASTLEVSEQKAFQIHQSIQKQEFSNSNWEYVNRQKYLNKQIRSLLGINNRKKIKQTSR